MKKIKFALLGTLVVAAAVVAFALPTHKLSPVTYWYKNGTCDQYIPTGRTGQFDCRENSLTSGNFKSTSNWTTTSQVSCAGGNYICSIAFDEETTADGGNDGQLTLQEALDALWNYYAANSTLPATLTVGTGPNAAVITISTHNAVH